MTDDLNQTPQATPQPTSEPSAPASAPSPSSDTSAALPGASSAGAPAGGDVQWTSIRDQARQMGVPLDHYPDDHQAFRDMLAAYQQLPQLQQLARYGRDYVQHADQFQKWLQNQQPGQRQPQQPQSWWSPPAEHSEIQRLVDQWFTTDARGQLQPRADAPASAIQKVNDYAEFQRQWQHKLFHNPKEALRDAVREEAQRLYQEQSTNQQAIAATNQIMRDNAEWLYYKDQRGVPMTGQYTPRGLQYLDYVQKIEAYGVRDPRAVNYLALSMLQRDIYQESQQPQAPAQPQAGQRTTAYREPQRQSQPSGQGALAAMLAQSFAANGLANTSSN